MTKRTVFRRASRVAMLSAALSLVVGALPVHAASAVEIEARALVGGRYEIGGWLAVAVTLVNPGAPTDGYLSAETESGVVRRYVEMPAGARKVVTLYVEPEAFQREVRVSYAEPNGTVNADTEVRVLEQSADQVAIVGDTTGALRPQLLGTEQSTRPEPISLPIFEIPERPEPLDGLAAIVWAGDSAALSDAQRGSIERWVADGGQLVVIGGPDWQARTAAFGDLLPLDGLVANDDTEQEALGPWTGATEAPLATATTSTGSLRDEARAIVTADDGTILASLRPFGAGQVVLFGSDLATDAFRAWEGSPRLWERLLPSNAALEGFFGGGFPPGEELLSSMTGALGSLPTLQVPPAELLLAVIVGYILLIGPVSYVVLRRVDRRELAWVTAPILILLFSACSYGIGRSLKGSDVVVNQVSVVRTSPTGAALAETYAGIFSPDRTTYDLTVDADALMGALNPAPFDGRQVGSRVGDVVVEQGQPAHLRDLAIGAFGFAGVVASGLVDVEPALSVTWASSGGDMIGTVTNSSDTTLSDVAYISSSGGERIGDIAPGASVEFTIPGRNFNGSSASDQVYGFGGFGENTEGQRLIALRRQVIDALVGYGGWGGLDGGVSLGARGPYLIGWREADGPMPIAVDGLDARRHLQSVEVLSVRPTFGFGEVTVPAHRMSVSVTDVVGDVQAMEPGFIALNDGSVTFSIALPLEASGLQASAVEIIVGPDASVVIDPGNVGGFWPAGFSVEVRNPATGEWSLLGDLSERASFKIDDASTVMSAAGIIEVRITGAGDPDFGQTGVYATASVSGVLDR